MGFSMITDVGEKLVEVLSKALVPDVITHSGSIGLCSPEDHGDYSLGVYLFDVNPCDDVPAGGMMNTGLDTQTYPSTYVTLDYMVTAYSQSDLKFRAGEEQKILGRVIQALGDARMIPAAKLGIGVTMNAKIELRRLSQEEKMRMWVFPEVPYKLSLFYRVTPVEIASSKVNSIVRVRDINMLVDEDRVLFHSSLVVLPIDDFTGRPITGSGVSLQIEGEKPPVVKGDGYRIFTNLNGKDLTLRGMGGLYEPIRTRILLEERDPDEILVLRMTPGRAYPLPEGMTSIAIMTVPERSLKIWTTEGGGFKLSRDYKKDDGRELSLYNPDEVVVEGRGFYIESGKDTKWLRVTAKRGKKVLLEEGVDRDYSKTETTLWPVSEVQADARGECFLPVMTPGNKQPGDTMTWQYLDAEGNKGSFEVELGRENRIEL